MTFLYASHIELVEQLSHVVLATSNLQLGWIGPVVADMSQSLAHLCCTAPLGLEAPAQVVEDTDVVLEEVRRQVEAGTGHRGHALVLVLLSLLLSVVGLVMLLLSWLFLLGLG